jgi:hypothetical protein
LLAGLKQRKKSVCTESIQDFKTDARDTWKVKGFIINKETSHSRDKNFFDNDKRHEKMRRNMKSCGF